MQNREKKLAIGLGAVVGVMAVWSILRPWYFGPIEQEQAQLTLVQTDLDNLKKQQLQLLAATRKMADWKAKSLPPDPKPAGRQRADALKGQNLYQEWLTELARHSGFDNTEVVPLITRSVQDVYVTAQVRVRGEATYGELCQFLSLFEQADLMHRIESCLIESSNHIGDPVFDVNLVAEGVALQNAPQRDLLFPKTELASAMDGDDVKLLVADAGGFPSAGRFGIRIDEELLSVIQVKGKEWQITRGKDETKPVAHAAGVTVDLGLYDPLTHEGPERARHPRLAMIADQNPFTIPPPKAGDPYLNLPKEQTVYLGSRMAIDAKAEGLNPTLGPPKFELTGTVPEGMRIETTSESPFSGLITWEPVEESLIDTYNVSIKVTRADLPQALTGTVLVRVEEQNDPPVIAALGRQLVYSGQPLNFTVKATDLPGQQLTYSLGAGAPPEAAIDPVTGKFSWTPPGVVTEQVSEIEIVATDSGRPPANSSIKVPVEVKADVAHFTKFVGSLAVGEAHEAWFVDQWNSRNLVLKEGEMLEIADISARLVKVETSVLVFERNGKRWELELGHEVRGMKPTAPVQSAETATGELAVGLKTA